MCGILIHFNQERDFIDYNSFYEELFYMRRKGDEGVGIGVIKRDGNFIIIKNMNEEEDVAMFIANNHYKLKPHFTDKNTFAIVAHGRKPSTGIGYIGTQPFYSDRFMLVHNGHIPFISNFIPKSENYCYYCDSDSERMLSYLYDRENNKNYKVEYFYDFIWDRIGTVGIVVTYDKITKTMYIYRDKERDLFFEFNNDLKLVKLCNLEECSDMFFDNGIAVSPGVYTIKLNGDISKVKRFSEKECFIKKSNRYKFIKKYRNNLINQLQGIEV